MTESTHLERRYRRLLALYPRAFRRDREHEMLSVLMDGAEDGQEWPRLNETTDLVGHAIPMHVDIQVPSRWERKYPNPWILFRLAVGIWLLALTGYFCQANHWWALVLLPFAALHFYLAYRTSEFAAERRRDAGGPRAAIVR